MQACRPVVAPCTCDAASLWRGSKLMIQSHHFSIRRWRAGSLVDAVRPDQRFCKPHLACTRRWVSPPHRRPAPPNRCLHATFCVSIDSICVQGADNTQLPENWGRRSARSLAGCGKPKMACSAIAVEVATGTHALEGSLGRAPPELEDGRPPRTVLFPGSSVLLGKGAVDEELHIVGNRQACAMLGAAS